MGGVIRIVVKCDPARTSPNQRLHWAERHRRNDAARAAARAGWMQAGCPVATGRVRVSFIVRRGRKLDADNALAGCKPIIDALFGMRRRPGRPTNPGLVTTDDSPRWLELGEVRQETGARWRHRAEVEVVIESIESEETPR